jgi:hypothetical protein
MKPRTLTIVAAVVGGLLPLRPLFFTNPIDPTAETIDLIISPAYVFGRALPPMRDFGSLAFLAAVILTNAVLYGSVARYLYARVFHSPPR